jgi:hypothetical protein
MVRFPFRQVILVLAVIGALSGRAEAQLITGDDGLITKLNRLRPFDSSQPVTVSDLCHRLDCLAEELRDNGLIVVKQPDVFSQARMTRFRNDFENQMSSDLANFHLVLAARINRLDSATTTQTTALGAALSAPGTTNVTAPAASASDVLGTQNNLFSGGTSLFGGQIAPNQGAFGNLTLATNNFSQPASSSATAALGLGVDPTVYLDEKKRFLDHLNEIRRINLGPDQNDSSGYGLYLVRLPVSITPGECTYQGHGAELSVSVEHEFSPHFLPRVFHNLVVNDVVDQIGPFIYEIIRSGFYDELLKPREEAKIKQATMQLRKTQFLNALKEILSAKVVSAQLHEPNVGQRPVPGQSDPAIAKILKDYILRCATSVPEDAALLQSTRNTAANRLTALIDARESLIAGSTPGAVDARHGVALFRNRIALVRRGAAIDANLSPDVDEYVRYLVDSLRLTGRAGSIDFAKLDYPRFAPFVLHLYETALPDDAKMLDDLVGLTDRQRTACSVPLATNNLQLNQVTNVELAPLNEQIAEQYSKHNKLALPSTRSAKRYYPIAPRELKDFFLEENLNLLAKDAREASRTKTIRKTEVRNYLRHTLETAYFAMCCPTKRAPEVLPPLADDDFLSRLLEAIHEREFGVPGDRTASRLRKLYDELVDRLELSRDNIKGQPIAALCWAIAVDAVLLDSAFHDDAQRVFSTKGLPCDILEAVHFYYPMEYPNDAGKAVFCDYVRNRWPIITFSLDPVTDQQNIADSFNLKRDLQLAVSFAFATGQINFSQLSTFRRQIEQSSDTIALNRTVTAFAHGTDIFGFRFTPRFQNPPNQRTNIGVIASQLIGGGPGPDYQLRKSKLESGQRELTAVLLLPTFSPMMRMNVAGNWFKLNDPEHLVFHTGHMMERGRRVQELRQAVIEACNAEHYREDDLRVLRGKLAQLEAMLPMQSKVIELPFENSASGFDLFSGGATALVPELTGFSGVDVIKPCTSTATTTSPPATTIGVAAPAPITTAPPPPAPGLTVTTTTSTPAGTQSVSVVGGSGSIADVFVFGKYISLLDSKVIAGGRTAAFEILSREVVHVQVPANVIPTTTEDGGTYVEIYVATPNGISNSILVPYDPGPPPPEPPPPSPIAYDVAPASQTFDVFYQWLVGANQRPGLVASAAPSASTVAISWDSGTGLGPKQIQVQFSGTINNQNVVLSLPATPSDRGDYGIDGARFTVTLLKRLEEITAAPGALPTSISLSVAVQPWLPANSEGLRVRSEPKTLKSKVTVNLHYNATGVNALPQAAPAVIPAPAAAQRDHGANGMTPIPAMVGLELSQAQGAVDPALVRVAHQLPSFLNAPQAPAALNRPSLLAPNITSEAEQVARLLTGQPLPANVQGLSPVASLSGGRGPGEISNVAAAATTLAGQAAPAQMPPIVVTPSPVMVVSPPPTDAKKRQSKSRLHKMMNSIGNRFSQALPGR